MKTNILQYDQALKNAKNINFFGYPKTWPKFYNACSDACDMLVGPCACGAWHTLEDWQPGSSFARRLGIEDEES